ncbi:ArsR/SmtB family transcription factor [Trichococcus patagoniensis]|uniref:ArsR/SmtB family transcription factor n=1 Tax=Trichococcus patagoniensis TaxID=382641 RepID=UPI000D3CD93B|nr:ArsR family transcriptional regulator [Trichococcus patagoniensis]
MQLDISESSLAVYEVLASDVRLKIIQLLSRQKMNVKDLALELNLSSAIISKHIKKLEGVGIIKTERIPGISGMQKVSILKVDHIDINFPKKIYHSFETFDTAIPIGHYTDYHVTPTCGLANSKDFIGQVDEPKYFMDSGRMDASILWFTSGYVEYKTPNFLTPDDSLEQIDISMEISSEFPFSNDVWPSDITFTLNGTELGTWTSPGDFADTRGKLNPSWWPSNLNQYGLLKTLRVTHHGTYMDGDPLSQISISDLDTTSETWEIRIEVKPDAAHVGGMTLFGKKFGNHDQDINFKAYYS